MSNKTSRYHKDLATEELFERINNSLEDIEQEAIKDFNKPEIPVVFIVGIQRSGTTLLMQLLANHFEINYPDNLIARFWRAPYIGAQLKEQLAYKIENDLTSDLGFTAGISQPHEFGYFWKRWFSDTTSDALENSEAEKLNKELDAWQKINNKPLVFKNLIQVVPNLVQIAQKIPNSYFLFVKRQNEFVIQSTLNSRKKMFGNHHEWFGIKPSNFKDIIQQKDPVLQVTEQVYYLNKDFKDFKKAVRSERILTVEYEKLAENTNLHLEKIKDWLQLDSSEISNDNKSVINKNEITLSKAEFQKIKDHFKKLNQSNS